MSTRFVAQSFSVGTIVAQKYRLLRQLGEGAMGVVWLAINETTGGEVALKLIVRPDPELRVRLLREARACCSIRHRNVIQIHDVGAADDGDPFLVMEVLSGETLADLLARKRRLGQQDTATIGRDIARALAAAHASGIVHRDLKPANIYLHQQAGEDRPIVKVLDFGVSKNLLVPDGMRTVAGGAVGSPMYMSPEQAQGDSTVDGRSDIWSLGVILFEMLTGQKPFTGDVAEVVYKLVSGEIPAVSRKIRKVDAALDQLVASCMRRSRDERPWPASELAKRLDALAEVSWRQALPSNTDFESNASAPAAYDESSNQGKAALTSAILLPANIRPVIQFRREAQLDESSEEAIEPDAANTLRIAPQQGSTPAHEAPAAAGVIPLTFSPLQMGPSGTVVPPTGTLLPMAKADATSATAIAALGRLLPAPMTQHVGVIARFLDTIFTGFECVEKSGIVRIYGLRGERTEGYQIFAVFMAASTHAPNEHRLGTHTFLRFTRPLESYLGESESDVRKLVVAIVDSTDIGEGVRARILEYRRRWSAVVVPLYVGEVCRADRYGRLQKLFNERLTDFHTRPDLYAGSDPAPDPTRFYGRKAELNALTSALRDRKGMICLCGPPGSGKTYLVRMAEYGIERVRMIYLRCSEVAARNASAFTTDLLVALQNAKQSPESSSTGTIRERLLPAVDIAAASAMQAGEHLVVVLDDADWLLQSLMEPGTDASERDRVQELWTTLAACVRATTLSVVVASFYGFILKLRVIAGWQNPTQVTYISLDPLRFEAIEKMVRETGIEINVSFQDSAMEEIYRCSGGNVDLARKLCSRALTLVQSERSIHPLEPLKIGLKTVQSATDDLAAVAATFCETLIPSLGIAERLVLQTVAARRPRTDRSVKAALADECKPEECAEALHRVREMGLVEVSNRRIRVKIPLLENWMRLHLEDAPTAARRLRSRRIRLVAAGVSMTALLFGAYITWFKARTILSDDVRIDGCSYQVRYPERAALGDTTPMYVWRECDHGDQPVAVDLVAVMGTVAKVADHSGGTTNLFPCVPGNDCRMAVVPTTFISPTNGQYEFRLESAGRTVLELSVRDDPFAALKRTLDGAVQIAAALPAILGIVLAFYRDALNALRGVWGTLRGSPPTSGPGTPNSSTE